MYRGSLTYTCTGGSPASLEGVAFDGGRFVAVGNSSGGAAMTPMLYVTDHLGSVRTVVNGTSGAVVETSDYYPFGGRWNDSAALTDAANRYRYNSKEEQALFGTPYSDYGARQYHATTGSWLSIDPLADKYYSISPYAFCANNPVNLVDPDGKDWYEDEVGNAKWIDNNTLIHIDQNCVLWRNIGTEYIFFDGGILYYYNQSSGKTYNAVSGRPDGNGNFIYTKDRQSHIGEGPIPEGRYHINPKEIQSYLQTSVFQNIASLLGMGAFPNGPIAWGF